MTNLRRAGLVALLLALVACADKSTSPVSSSVDAAKPSETGATAAERPEPRDPAVAASLKDEIRSVQAQITAADAESGRYTGGLVKALIESRVQTLRQTLAMLEQRDKAWTFGLRLRYTIDGKPFSLP